MSFGTGIFLLVVGAILTFALDVQLSWIDLDLVGYILMIAGVLVIILGFVLMARKRHSSVSVRREVDPSNGATYDTTERRDDPNV